jgi:hypothetical protein
MIKIPVTYIPSMNHYKRGKNLEQFREYIATLQSRIDSYHFPKWCNNIYEGYILHPNFEEDKNNYRKNLYDRYRYIKEVAALFSITKETPFSGKFYFETLEAK